MSETDKTLIENWLKEHDLFFDTKVYSKQEWKDRNEQVGNNSELTITAEGSGSLSRVYNYGFKDDIKTREAFEKFVESLGYYVEQGYSWSWHLYNLKEK